jgi:hypothetical protein
MDYDQTEGLGGISVSSYESIDEERSPIDPAVMRPYPYHGRSTAFLDEHPGRYFLAWSLLRPRYRPAFPGSLAQLFAPLSLWDVAIRSIHVFFASFHFLISLSLSYFLFSDCDI